jgi:hypothetical protein
VKGKRYGAKLMPISVKWDNDKKTVVHYEFNGKWTWEEYHSAIQQAYEMVKELPYIVNMILDFRFANVLPSNALSIFGRSMKTPPKEFDLALIVSKSGFIEAIYNVFRRLNGKMAEKLVLVRTIEEARSVLADYDAKRTTPVAMT